MTSPCSAMLKASAHRDYFYSIMAKPGSGEHALRHLLGTFAYPHQALGQQLHALKVRLRVLQTAASALVQCSCQNLGQQLHALKVRLMVLQTAASALVQCSCQKSCCRISCRAGNIFLSPASLCSLSMPCPGSAMSIASPCCCVMHAHPASWRPCHAMQPSLSLSRWCQRCHAPGSMASATGWTPPLARRSATTCWPASVASSAPQT